MNSDCFPENSQWHIPRSVLFDSLEEMKKSGEHGDEGIALWLGHRDKGKAEVTHTIVLRGHRVYRRPANIRIESSLINDVTDIALQVGVVLIGQIHSHGPGFGINLSNSDRTLGFAFPGYLSIVAPEYAQLKSISLNKCGIFVFDQGTGFRRMDSDEIKKRLKIGFWRKSKLIKVGEEW